MNCDKCGEPVERTNDAVRVAMAAFPESAWLLITAQPRHFLATKKCPGSPSRAQYIEGQPRDTRFAYLYDVKLESRYREAYLTIMQEGSTPV